MDGILGTHKATRVGNVTRDPELRVVGQSVETGNERNGGTFEDRCLTETVASPAGPRYLHVEVTATRVQNNTCGEIWSGIPKMFGVGLQSRVS